MWRVMVLVAVYSLPSTSLYVTVAVMSFWPHVWPGVASTTIGVPASFREELTYSLPSTLSVKDSNVRSLDGIPLRS